MKVEISNINIPIWKEVNITHITSVSKVMNISVRDIDLLLKKAGAPIRNISKNRLNKLQLEILSHEYVRGLKRYYSKTTKHFHQLDKSEIEDFEIFYASFHVDNKLKYDYEGYLVPINTFLNSQKGFEDGSFLMSYDSLNNSESVPLSLLIQSDNSYYSSSEEQVTCQLNKDLSSWKELDDEALRQTFYELLQHEGIVLDNFESHLQPGIFDLMRKVKAKKKKTLTNIIRNRFFKIKTKVKNNYKVILSIMTSIIISCRYYIFVNDNDEHSKVAIFASFE